MRKIFIFKDTYQPQIMTLSFFKPGLISLKTEEGIYATIQIPISLYLAKLVVNSYTVKMLLPHLSEWAALHIIYINNSKQDTDFVYLL